MSTAARSVHLWFVGGPFRACYLCGRIEEFASSSYFSGIAFKGGYFGVQELHDGRHVQIFSLWHDEEEGTGKVIARAQEHTRGTADVVRGFAGEGTGVQTIGPFAWQTGATFDLMLTAHDENGRTVISARSRLCGTEWLVLSSLSRVGTGRLIDGWYAFVEDFGKNVKPLRSVTIIDAWGQDSTGAWKAIITGVSDTVPEGPPNFDVRMVDNRWVLETGGDSKTSTPPRTSLTRDVTGLKPPVI